MTDSDLAALKKAMADAHPDRGGTNEAFIKARKAYLAAKWPRKEDTGAAQTGRREEAQAAQPEADQGSREAAGAAEDEKRRREAAGATANFSGRAAKAIYACAAVFLVFTILARYKERLVTTDAGRHGDLAVTSTTPPPQFAPAKPYEAVSDGPGTSTQDASADKPRPAATVTAKEVDATMRSAAADPSTPEEQAKSTVYTAMLAANTGNVGDTSNCYADTVTYYNKRMSRSDVIADKMKLWERWPTRNYAIRPDSLTANCYVIRRGTVWMNCNVTGAFDWEATNSSKRSVGSASITYTLMGPSNSDPLDLRIVDENSTVITRTVTDIGKQRAPRTAAPD
jgi:hypothetical protein